MNMNRPEVLLSPAAVAALAKRLGQIKRVGSLDEEGHNESEALAHAIADIAESMSTTQSLILPKFRELSQSDEKILDALIELGEELRHMLYHVRSARFFGYLEP